MELIHPSSLSETVNAVNEAYFQDRETAVEERREAARWIAGRQGLPGAYAGTFALMPDELRDGVRLFTGERTKSAAARHITGEEACRALRLLGVTDGPVTDALETASHNLAERVGPIAPPTGSSHWFDVYRGGVFCCGRCSVGLWRHILAGGFDDHERRLAVGLRCLADRRRDDHTWSVFPFWYTLSALVEMPTDLSQSHLQHAAPRLERLVGRRGRRDEFASRRQEIARRALDLA